MKSTIFLLITVILFSSCISNTIYEKPNDLIPKDSMVLLIQEMTIASSAKMVKTVNLQRNINYFPFVFEKFKIDSTRFAKSSFYYTSKIDEYEEILIKVEESLRGAKEKYNDLKTKRDSIVRDSLNKIKVKKPKNKNATKENIDLLKNSKYSRVKI